MEPTPCQQHDDPDMWFSLSPYKAAQAVRLCATCPIQRACAEEALATDEKYGVWGGLTEDDRRRLTRSARTILEHRIRGAA